MKNECCKGNVIINMCGNCDGNSSNNGVKIVFIDNSEILPKTADTLYQNDELIGKDVIVLNTKVHGTILLEKTLWPNGCYLNDYQINGGYVCTTWYRFNGETGTIAIEVPYLTEWTYAYADILKVGYLI